MNRGEPIGGILTGIKLIDGARSFGDRTAVLASGAAYSYADLLQASETVAATLLGEETDLHERRIAFLVPASFEYVAVQWGIWRAGGIAVPLSTVAKDPELEHVLTDAAVSLALAPTRLMDRVAHLCRRIGIPFLSVEEALRVSGEGAAEAADPAEAADTAEAANAPGTKGAESHLHPLPRLSSDRRAMMLYTSGTTSKPKGVVSTHANIEAQVLSLVEAWGWEAGDRIPLFLPLHHIHGIVNVLSCALWSGALVDTFESFEMERILDRVRDRAYTVFMAVPTIYVKLIQAFEDAAPEERTGWAEGFRQMRLMISGSAALPASVHRKWTELTGQKLLERYGMTEIGMGLSNPLLGERRPGAVGLPLPGVEIRLVAESGEVISVEGEPGEIQIRGPAVFAEYWQKPDVTEASFTQGWFRTGDMAVLEEGYYRILGRLSVDIIKSGGYKISALEIEDVLRQHPLIGECAVVGVPDDVWGEVVAAAIATTDNADIPLEELRTWAEDRLSIYKIPRKVKMVEAFPRNAMGKVMKPAVKELFDPD